MNVALLGTGHIADQYVSGLRQFENVALTAVADTDEFVRVRRAAEWGVRALSPDALLLDDDVELLVNLTPPLQHAATTRAALTAGKHVYSEKPLAVTVDDGRALIELAARQGVTLACAPDTVLGSAFETATRAIEAGMIGRPVAAHAFVANAGPAAWHPAPRAYYESGGGPLFSLGPYYLTALVRLLGRIEEASGMSARPEMERGFAGGGFTITTDTTYAGAVRFASGPVASLFLSYDVASTRVPPLEIYGDEGTVSLADPNHFDGPVLISSQSGAWRELAAAGVIGYGRGVGVADQVAAITRGERPRPSAEIALHVLDALVALAEGGRPLETDPCHVLS